MPLTSKELEYIQDKVEGEGFDYAFLYETDFKDMVKDKKFHQLRLRFLKATKALAEYAGLDEVGAPTLEDL